METSSKETTFAGPDDLTWTQKTLEFEAKSKAGKFVRNSQWCHNDIKFCLSNMLYSTLNGWSSALDNYCFWHQHEFNVMSNCKILFDIISSLMINLLYQSKKRWQFFNVCNDPVACHMISILCWVNNIILNTYQTSCLNVCSWTYFFVHWFLKVFLT